MRQPYTRSPRIAEFTQYSGTFSQFAAEVINDWATIVNVFEDPSTPGQAICITGDNQILRVNPTEWIGYNDGSWEVWPNSAMQGYNQAYTSAPPPA